MKTSSDTPPGTVPDKATRRACLVANLSMPGLGSIAAGRKIGYVQMGVYLVGFAGSMVSVLAFLWQWTSRGTMPQEITNPALVAGVLSIGVAGIAWLWALNTSRQVEAESRCASRESALPPRLPPEIPPELPPEELKTEEGRRRAEEGTANTE